MSDGGDKVKALVEVMEKACEAEPDQDVITSAALIFAFEVIEKSSCCRGNAFRRFRLAADACSRFSRDESPLPEECPDAAKVAPGSETLQ